MLILIFCGSRQRPEEIDGVLGQEAKKVRDYSTLLFLPFLCVGVWANERLASSQLCSAVGRWTLRRPAAGGKERVGSVQAATVEFVIQEALC